MKLRKLIIHNIASIEDATIDFSAEPLSGSDVFLITGETGAGKSTILDAICLALYNDTPRMKNTKMGDGKVLDTRDEMTLGDTRRILRENAGEGSVNLTFVGSNGIPYEALWYVQRAYKKPTGALQTVKWSLKDLKSGTLYEKKEVKAEIAKAVGLTFDQFCRTTMLAQGEFTRFLNSRDEEKAEILEMITGADIYSKIGAKVCEITKQKKEEYEKARSDMEGVVLMTAEERGEKMQAIAGLGKRVQEAIASRDGYKAKVGWLETEAELSSHIAEAESALSAAREAAASAEFLKEKALIASWKESQEARSALAAEHGENAKADAAGRSIARMEDRYRKLRSGAAFLKEREDAIGRELASLRTFFEEEKAGLPVVEKAQTVEGQLDIIGAGTAKTAEWDEKLRGIERKLSGELVPGKTAAEEALSAANERKTQTGSTLQAAEEALSAAKLPALRTEITRLTAEKGNVQRALDRIGNYNTAWNAFRKEEEEMLAAAKELEGKTASREALAVEVGECLRQADRARMSYEAESMAADHAVTTIRSRLSVGCTCPVCMQTIQSALPTDEEIAARLRPLREADEAARRLYEEKKRQLDTLDAGIRAESGALKRRKSAHASDASVATCRDAVLEVLSVCGIGTFDAGTSSRLTERLQAIDTRLSELSALDQQGQALEKAVADARGEDAGAAARAEEARMALAASEKQVADARAEQTKLLALKAACEQNLKAAVAAVDAIVKGTGWELNWQSRRDAFRQELSNAVVAHRTALQRQETLLSEKRELSGTITSVSGILSEVEKIVPGWVRPEPAPAEELARPEEAARSLKDDLLIESQHEKIAREAAAEASEQVEAFLRSHPSYDRESLAVLSGYTAEAVAGMETHQKEVNDRVVIAATTLGNLQSQAGAHAAQKPAFDEGDTVPILKEKESACEREVLGLNAQATLLEQELRSYDEKAAQFSDLKVKADALRDVWSKWDRLNALIGDATGNKFRKIAQSYVLGSLVSAANHYMRELTDRYALKVVPGTFVISVEDAYQGFASRPASTISGGESFLVSLSLALALSDIGETLSVDTLFIDEGFGTLSGAPLQNAVNTLKALRKKADRHVGIISHIDELKDRIPVRIQVEKSGKTASSTVKVVEGDVPGTAA